MSVYEIGNICLNFSKYVPYIDDRFPDLLELFDIGHFYSYITILQGVDSFSSFNYILLCHFHDI